MAIETLTFVDQYERVPVRAVLDFATIRNPLGHTPTLETKNYLSDEKVTEGDLVSDMADLWGVSADMITLGNGSSDIIENIPKNFLSPGSRVVLPEPTYFGLFDVLVHNEIVPVSLRHEDHFTHTNEYLEILIDKIHEVQPGLVWLCSPNNPTGETIPLWQIARISQESPGLVIVDEAYQELVDPDNDQSAMRLITDHPNIVVTKTFSKAYGLPDIRVGVAIATPDITRVLQAARTNLIQPDSLKKAKIALKDQEHIAVSHLFISRETTWLWDQIQQMNYIEMGAKSQSGVCIVRHMTANLFEKLNSIGIKTSDFNAHRGLMGKHFVRLGILDHLSNIELVNGLRGLDIAE